MQIAQSTKTESGEFTDCGFGLTVRITRSTVKVSQKLELAMIMAGMPTDPDYFVNAVKEFYAFLIANRTTDRSWSFGTTETAYKAYEMLVRIASF